MTARLSERLAWPDLAKAICVCLVVLMHAASQIGEAGWAGHDEFEQTWHAINAFLRPIRMPTFFLISGLLAARAVRRPGEDANAGYFWKPIYLYVLWAIIFAVLIPNYPSADWSLGSAEHMLGVALLGSPAWYLYALALFFLVAKATLDLPAVWALGGCAVVALCGSWALADGSLYAANLPRCLFFFIAGARLRDGTVTYVEAASVGRMLRLLALYVLAHIIALRLDMPSLPLDLIATAFSVTAFGLLGRNIGALAVPAQWLGQRTLYIYLLHFPLLCFTSIGVRNALGPDLLGSRWLGLSYPIVATLLVVPASLVLGSLAQRGGLKMAFGLPGIFAGAVRSREFSVEPAK